MAVEWQWKVLIGLGALAALLIIILVPSSYADLDYYEMGFVKSKTTGSVETDKVYQSGRHWIGVTSTFKKFPADFHTLDFPQIRVFNKEKLSIALSCSLQYVLREEDLYLLHDTYDLAYAPIIESTTLAAIKSAAPFYTVDEYRLNRTMVDKGLSDAAAKALGGICCRKGCEARGDCKPGCLTYSSCKKEDKGLFAAMRYFQLQNVDLTPEQQTRYLTRVLEQEKKDTEIFLQREKLTRKNIEQERLLIENEAKEIAQKAAADSTLIVAKATAAATATTENARNQGLQLLYSTLNITDMKHKNSMDYLRTLVQGQNNVYVGFQYMVARP